MMWSLPLAAIATSLFAVTASAADASTTAPLSQVCPYSGVCYQLNIPNNTAQTGKGDIFFQIRASTHYQWVALGQGTGMIGSNIFVMWQSADGNNVTISPRYGVGHEEPLHDTRADIELLDGSGVQDGFMTANVRCGDCNSWAAGHMDFTKATADWLYAVKSGSPLQSNNVESTISKHDSARRFTWPMTKGKGGDSVNPFLTDEGKPITSNPSSSIPVATGPGNWVMENLPKLHGGLATLAFVILFPIGGILIRLANFRGGIWIHVGLQAIAWLIAFAAIASGIRLAVGIRLFLNAHPIIGLVLAALLVGQPIYGIIHHRKFKKLGHRTKWSYIHLTIGRAVVFVGMINGGLGIVLDGNVEQKYIIAYGVIAGVLALLYIASIVWGERRRKRTKMGPTGFRSEDTTSLLGRGRGVGDEQGLAQPQGQEMRPLWLAGKNRQSQEYAPLAVGEGYGDEGRYSQPGSRTASPAPGGLYSDHRRARSADARARVSMS